MHHAKKLQGELKRTICNFSADGFELMRCIITPLTDGIDPLVLLPLRYVPRIDEVFNAGLKVRSEPPIVFNGKTCLHGHMEHNLAAHEGRTCESFRCVCAESFYPCCSYLIL